MHISLTHPSDTQVKITIAASEQELTALKEQVLLSFQKKVKVQGFREGKAPLPMVEKTLDPNSLQGEFLDQALNQMYFKAVNEKQLRVVANPKVNITKFVPFSDLEFEADVEVLGDVKIPDYKKIKVTKNEVKITDKDVQGVIESLRQRIAEKKDVDRAAQDGDTVYIDFKGVDEKGEPVKGAEGKDYPLQLGSNSFIPGFESNIIGLKPGDEKTFTLKFPKDYGVKALASKDVTFTVSVSKVQESILPEMNDEFAAKAGPFKSVDELRSDIRTQLEIEKNREADRVFENEIVEAIAAKTKVSIPKSLVDNQIDRIEQEEKQNLVYRGQTWEEHLKEEGVDEEGHRESKRAQAEAQVRAGLALAEIADVEKIEVSNDELETRVSILKGQYQDKQMQEELSKPEAKREIASRLMTEKTLTRLVELNS